jgi:hypothetical protein
LKGGGKKEIMNKNGAEIPTEEERVKFLDEFNTFKEILLFNREELRNYGLEPNRSYLMPGFKNNAIEILYYGGNLASVTIDGEEIEERFEIPEARGLDDDLVYRITDEAIMFILQKLKER